MSFPVLAKDVKPALNKTTLSTKTITNFNFSYFIINTLVQKALQSF
ncbi:hypothetical protein KF146_2203 [Lactococcus lactis subsp. lactis]|nr:hypothetical protein KF146_2203 [Lactococcus lactis subsp. lactis]